MLQATRKIPAELRERYLAEGYWTRDTLAEWLIRAVEAAPDAAFVVHSDVRPARRTFLELFEEARRLNAALNARGLRRGDVVAYQLPNWTEAVTCLFALALGGFVAAPIVHIYGRKEVEFILRNSGARAYVSAAAFGHVDYNEIVDEAAVALPALDLHVVVSHETASPGPALERLAWSDFVAIEPAAEFAPCDPDDVCVLAYTSGTTSDPKGVLHTHHTLLAEMQHIERMSGIDGPTLTGSPISHATGMLGGVLLPLAAGFDSHLIDRWDAGRVLEIVEAEGVRAGAGAPFFLTSLLEHPALSDEHVERIGRTGLGGAPISPALAQRAETRGIQVQRAFGSTEHPSISASTFAAAKAQRHLTDGVPLAGVEVRLLDEMDHEVEDGVAGEIWSRGPDLCVGYTDATLTAEAFTPEGWFRTGDLGVRDANGAITITDRLKDVIIRGGENISAGEIEEALMQLPLVAEVAVVAAPDTRMGEHVCALIRLSPGASESLSLETLARHLGAAGLARQKWPEELRIVQDFPRTGTGKIRKVDLRRQLRSEAAGSMDSQEPV
jgi:acyl-CoA synthetase (AMP-forming)/AMP-acid ligase II